MTTRNSLAPTCTLPMLAAASGEKPPTFVRALGAGDGRRVVPEPPPR